VADWHLNEDTFARLVDDRKVQENLEARADAGVAAGVQACPTDTYLLVGTIRKERRGHGWRVVYGNDEAAYYAPYVEWGTRPHMIGNHHHPGTRAFHVLGGAALDAARRTP
jgi:hypothetical protein